MSESELAEIKRNAKDCTPGDVYALVREVDRLREALKAVLAGGSAADWERSQNLARAALGKGNAS